MFKVKVNEHHEFDIEKDQEHLKINGEQADWDLIELKEGKFNIILNNRVFNAEVIKANHAEKSFTIKVNGQMHQVAVKDKYDLLLKELGLENMHIQKINEIKAPMPGMVLNIMTENGQELSKGDSVLILEAMKMENVIKSPGDGKIKNIKVKQGQAVEKNQVLIELE